MFNEEDDDAGIPFHLHILQILVYAIMPAIVIIFSNIMPNDMKTATIIGGLIPFVLNLIIHVISYCLNRRSN